jgi:uncharacterized protein
MENNNYRGLVVPGIVLSIGLIIAALILANTWKNVSRSNVTITVTGSSEKDIRSDYAIWSGSFSAESRVLSDAYANVKKQSEKVVSYLIAKGVPQDKIKLSSVRTTTQYVLNDKGYPTDQVAGYRLYMDVNVESSDVDMIDRLSREASELINQGIDFNSNPPEFLYTKLADLKVEMIGLASQDAKVRAEQIAKSTGNEVGEVRSSRMGVIQINAKNSTDVSDYGINDTSSLEKTIRAVVSVSFSID